MLTKNQRINEANKVIAIIASFGRKFFASNGRIARFEADWQGRVKFRDAYSDRLVSLHPRSRMKGFSNGGTLEALVKALYGFIRTGVPIRSTWFGPWPPNVCGGDLWAYGKDMAKVRIGVLTTLAVVRPEELYPQRTLPKTWPRASDRSRK